MQLLPASELEVMLALWRADEAVPRAWLDNQLSQRSWNINTVNTYLSRLEEKGFVSCERQGRTKLYTPAISHEDYLAFEGTSVLNRLYNSSLKTFVASLAGSEAVGERQLEELRGYLDSLKEGDVDA